MYKDYKLLVASGSNKLSDMVNEYIAKGYEPQGSASAAPFYADGEVRYQYTQAVVLYEE